MPQECKVGNSTIRIMRGDITALETDALVFYARPDLNLGSGFGTAISVRGGPEIQKALNELGQVNVCESVVTTGGNLKTKHIIHAVGPRFQEEDSEGKLRKTVLNALKKADEVGAKTMVFPPMGAGFYGVPLEVSARTVIEAVKEYLGSKTNLGEVTVCVMDSRDYKVFEAQLKAST